LVNSEKETGFNTSDNFNTGLSSDLNRTAFNLSPGRKGTMMKPPLRDNTRKVMTPKRETRKLKKNFNMVATKRTSNRNSSLVSKKMMTVRNNSITNLLGRPDHTNYI